MNFLTARMVGSMPISRQILANPAVACGYFPDRNLSSHVLAPCKSPAQPAVTKLFRMIPRLVDAFWAVVSVNRNTSPIVGVGLVDFRSVGGFPLLSILTYSTGFS